jgi:hypothetical protein
LNFSLAPSRTVGIISLDKALSEEFTETKRHP